MIRWGFDVACAMRSAQVVRPFLMPETIVAPHFPQNSMHDAHINKFTHRTTTFHGQRALQLSGPDGSEAVILLQGAHVVSWKAAGGVERLFLSEKALYRPGVAVRGGMPVIFPQFANCGPLPKHGFARVQEWILRSVDTTATDALLVLALESNASTRDIWPFDFVLELSVRLSDQHLDVELAVSNTGDRAMSFTSALHTYLSTEDLSRVGLEGLQGSRYRDSISQTEHTDREGVLRIGGELDRIYFNVGHPVVLRCPGSVMNATQVSQVGFEDVVVWNPGPEQSAALADMPNDGWRRMICIEASKIGLPVQLVPGEDWYGRQSIDCGSSR